MEISDAMESVNPNLSTGPVMDDHRPATETRSMIDGVLSRRQWLKNHALGFGSLALAGLMGQTVSARTAYANGIQAPHFPTRAKRVIFLFMNGGQSQMDLFDPKSELRQRDGQVSTDKKERKFKGSPFFFGHHGHSGLQISETLPHLASRADDLCIVRSMYTDSGNHSNAMLCFHTGSQSFVRPSLGSWVLYGLGAENESIPGFIAIRPSRSHGSRVYANAFLPANYQGLALGHDGIPAKQASIKHLTNPQWSSDQQRRQLDWLQVSHQQLKQQVAITPELEGFIQSYEMAFRMQAEAPQLLDLTQEPQYIRTLYGVDESDTDEMGRMCLLARRFVEAGVRFVQVNHNSWDHHGSIDKSIPETCRRVDRPMAALIHDLAQRGMLEETLIVSSGEFGRTATAEGEGPSAGRDHNAKGFSLWMAGGGVRGGMAYGQTDELGIQAVVDRAHIHDLHATILHLLGIDHERLTYRYAGRDFRLTDVYGRVLNEIIL